MKIFVSAPPVAINIVELLNMLLDKKRQETLTTCVTASPFLLAYYLRYL